MPYHMDIIPYTCVYIDCCWKDIFHASGFCLDTAVDRPKLISNIQQLWTSKSDPRPVLPCLSVRTGLDLFLRLQNYPPGSEVIMSAINIPDMVHVVHSHKLKIIALDVALETLAPKDELLSSLVSEKTVAILLAHLYGKRFDMEPFVKFAKKYNLSLIEDCAEAFVGFHWMGHPEADVSLFSFGAIKYSTAFGGAVVKIKNQEIYDRISDLYRTYPIQKENEYLGKLLKYSLAYVFLNCPRVIKPTVYISHALNIDHKKLVVKMLRGFPNEMLKRIQHQPSSPLLQMMMKRFTNFQKSEIDLATSKGNYVAQRLPEPVIPVGHRATLNNYWLFPVIVEDPEEVMKSLNALGVDAYRGSTQLSLIETDNGDSHLRNLDTFVTRYPHEARFLMDHVIYLPVNKTVPFKELDKICEAVDLAVRSSGKNSIFPPTKELRKLKLTSKL